MGANADPNQNEKVVKQNLGDQQAAFAVFNQTLSDKVRQLPSDYVFKMDLRYAFNTNGNETIWAQATDLDRAFVSSGEACEDRRRSSPVVLPPRQARWRAEWAGLQDAFLRLWVRLIACALRNRK
jgi:hypothetical protein